MNKLLQTFGSKIQLNYPLSKLTTLCIGGPAKYFLEAQNQEDLIETIKIIQAENIPYLVIGEGSNLLVSDEGFPGIVIQNALVGINLGTSGVACDRTTIGVHSGTKLQDLVNFTISQGLSGIQKLAGIPGTVGGAIYGNAGAYGQQICDHLQTVICLNPQTGQLLTIKKEECGFGYRDSQFKRNHLLILEAHFQFLASLASQGWTLQEESQKILAERTLKYPPNLRCPGSFFKNILANTISKDALKLIPQEKILYGKIPAGYLLEEVGAKGQKLGQIQVSPHHANLFINLGKGTATDFYNLAKTYAQKVKEKFGIELEPEVQLINLPKLN